MASNNGDFFSINYAGGDGNDIVLMVTAIPEPSRWVAGSLMVGFVGFSQRKRLYSRKLSEFATQAHALKLASS